MAAQPDQPLIDKARLWSAPLVIAWVVNFCLGFVFYLLMTSLALYAVDRFGVSDAAGGFAASVFVLGATAARLFAGSLVDAVGGHRIMTGSLAVMPLVSLGYLVVDDYALLLVVRGAHGVAFGVASTATMTIAQSVIPVQRHAEGTGYFTLSTTVATALGPLVALLLVDSVGYQGLFGAGTLAATMATVLGLCLRAPEHRHGTVERGPVRRFRLTGLLYPRVVPVASFMSVMAICY